MAIYIKFEARLILIQKPCSGFALRYTIQPLSNSNSSPLLRLKQTVNRIKRALLDKDSLALCRETQ
jgi:hypothetical protein